MSAVFWIKLFHTLVYIAVSAAIGYLLYSGIFNVRGTGLAVAVIVVLAEIVIFAANGRVCPLTQLARRLGDETGNDFIADIFVPKRFVRLVPLTCGGLAFTGLTLVGLRLLIG